MTEYALRLAGSVARDLTSFEGSAVLYKNVLKSFARAVGADIAVSLRTAEEGGLFSEEYGKEPSGGSEKDEWERKRNLLKTAFNPRTADEKPPREAEEKIRAERWAVVRSFGDFRSEEPSYLIALASSSGELASGSGEIVESGMEILAPLLRTRITLAKRERERLAVERELRTSEQELRRFFEDSKDMIYIANAEDRIASINKAGLALLGIENRFDVIGRRFSKFVLNPPDRDSFLRKIRDEGFVRDFEIVIKRPGADPIFCVETAHAVLRPDGTLSSIQGIVRDISERIQSEKALWMANLELAEANEKLRETQMTMIQQEKLASIGQLAAGVAHEINNPLGFMKSNFNTARDYFYALHRAWTAAEPILPPQVSADLEKKEDLSYIAEEMPKIFSETEDGYSRIIEIVSQLKAFSRLDAEAKRAPYDLERGIESTLVVAANEIKYVADVERNFAGIGPIEAEGGAVNQVLLNIFVNAAQAIASQKRQSRGRIVVSTRQDDDSVYCAISDDGPGMDEETSRRIFDPFFTTKAPGKGTGLGLSISYDIIVHKHGGRLTVASKPGNGAVFEIALPKKPLPAK